MGQKSQMQGVVSGPNSYCNSVPQLVIDLVVFGADPLRSHDVLSMGSSLSRMSYDARIMRSVSSSMSHDARIMRSVSRYLACIF